MTIIHQLDLRVWLTPDEWDTVQVAGVRFARTLAGAADKAFVMALGEQQNLMHDAMVEAGVTARNAQLTASAFETGAWLEWERVSSLLLREVAGNA